MVNQKYNYKTYWLDSGKQYFDKFKYTTSFEKQERVLINKLKELEFKTVLEFGCGFGRITKIINSLFHVEYDAIDISKEQLDHAKKYAGNEIHFIQSDIIDLNTEKKYDLVIGCEVLMHIPPELIKDVVGKLLMMSNRYLINIDVYNYQSKLANHNFDHPYKKLYEKFKTTVIDIKNFQSLFCVYK